MACGMGGALGGLCMFPPFMSSTSGTIIMMSLLLLLLGSAAQSPSITHDAFGNLRSKISGGKQDEDGRGGGGKRDERHLEVNGLLVRTRTEREEKGLYSECRIHTSHYFYSGVTTQRTRPHRGRAPPATLCPLSLNAFLHDASPTRRKHPRLIPSPPPWPKRGRSLVLAHPRPARLLGLLDALLGVDPDPPGFVPEFPDPDPDPDLPDGGALRFPAPALSRSCLFLSSSVRIRMFWVSLPRVWFSGGSVLWSHTYLRSRPTTTPPPRQPRSKSSSSSWLTSSSSFASSFSPSSATGGRSSSSFAAPRCCRDRNPVLAGRSRRSCAIVPSPRLASMLRSWFGSVRARAPSPLPRVARPPPAPSVAFRFFWAPSSRHSVRDIQR